MRESASAEAGGEVAEHQGLPALARPDSPVELRAIPVDRIETPRRPARRFLGDVAALADSMQDFGLQQPISVRVDGDHFILTSGLRRLTAARLLRWQTIPAFVRNVSADHAYVLDLIENLQRQDLSPEEEADALVELIRTRGWTLQQVAETIKRSLGYVSKRVRLFEDALLRDAVTHRGMPVSTAEELLAAKPAHRALLIEQALAERWDQVRAREVLRALEQAQGDAAAQTESPEGSPLPPAIERATVSQADMQHMREAAIGELTGRPRGFTRTIREFHHMLSELQAKDLTPSDRSALRALFRDLLILARAPTKPTPPVFPPLPTGRRSRR